MFSCVLCAQTPAPKPAPPAAKPAQAQPKPATAPAKPALALTSPAPAEAAGDPVVVTVGAETITRSQFETIIKALPENTQRELATPEARRQLAERVAEIKAIAQEARRRSIQDRATVRTQTRLSEDNLLANVLFQELLSEAKPTEEETRKYYAEHQSDYETVAARHILVRFQGSRVPVREGAKDLTEEESLARAKELRERIVKGEDFAAVAKAESDDAGSGAQGGSLGEFSRGRMVPAFEEAVFALPVGEISEPVKSQFGYHVIQVQKRESKSFDEVRADIERKQKPEMAREAMDAIKAKTPTTLNESYFAPRVAPGTPAAPAPGTPAVKK